MELKTLIYTSEARLNIRPSEVADIIAASQINNPLDGITGLLIFNGAIFLQIIEGSESAVDDLSKRLSGDPRHRNMCIHQDLLVAERVFPDWSMAYLRLENGTFIGEAAVENALRRKLSPALRSAVLSVLGVTNELSRAT
jgi:hypothetical protein